MDGLKKTALSLLCAALVGLGGFLWDAHAEIASIQATMEADQRSDAQLRELLIRELDEIKGMIRGRH